MLLVVVILLSVVNLGNHSFGGKRASFYTFQGLCWRTLRLAVARAEGPVIMATSNRWHVWQNWYIATITWLLLVLLTLSYVFLYCVFSVFIYRL